MSEPHPIYTVGTTTSDTDRVVLDRQILMTWEQFDRLQALIEQVKAHGWGEIEIVIRDHRVTLFRVTENHK